MIKFYIVLECDTKEFTKIEFKRYVKEALQTWCKSFDPDGIEFNIGDKIKLVSEKALTISNRRKS